MPGEYIFILVQVFCKYVVTKNKYHSNQIISSSNDELNFFCRRAWHGSKFVIVYQSNGIRINPTLFLRYSNRCTSAKRLYWCTYCSYCPSWSGGKSYGHSDDFEDRRNPSSTTTKPQKLFIRRWGFFDAKNIPFPIELKWCSFLLFIYYCYILFQKKLLLHDDYSYTTCMSDCRIRNIMQICQWFVFWMSNIKLVDLTFKFFQHSIQLSASWLVFWKSIIDLINTLIGLSNLYSFAAIQNLVSVSISAISLFRKHTKYGIEPTTTR